MIESQQLGEIRQMTGEMLGAMRALAPLPEALKTHASKVDHALELLDARLDQVERSHIKLDATLTSLTARIDEVFAAVTKRVDELHESIEARFEKQEKALEKHAERIKSLEDDRTRVKAWAALIALLGSIAAFLIGKFWPK